MLTVDGAFGEGGGQIVRSSLALSLVTGQEFTVGNIRARRSKPGLMRQHLTAVEAAAQIGQADVRGAALGSAAFSFVPSGVSAGEYTVRIGTAGSATLVLQTVLPALLLADGPSRLVIEGGTHNPFAPPYDFLAAAYLPLINRMGPVVRVELDRHGFYPAGGGRITVHVQPAERLVGFELLERGEVIQRRVRALVANLPSHIARRECDTIAKKSRWPASCFSAEQITDTPGPGNAVLIEIQSRHVTELFTGFGRLGVKAEKVAADVWREANAYLKAGVPVGTHLADQLLLPLGIAAASGHGGAFRTLPLSQHATTHLEVLRTFLDVPVDVQPDERGGYLMRLG